MTQIIIRYDGMQRRPPVVYEDDTEHMQLILERGDGTTEVIFTGGSFSEEKWRDSLEDWYASY